jgi:hypothetical protein
VWSRKERKKIGKEMRNERETVWKEEGRSNAAYHLMSSCVSQNIYFCPLKIDVALKITVKYMIDHY